MSPAPSMVSADDAPPAPLERWVILGRIASAFGIHGWVKVVSFTDPPGNILDYPLWRLTREEAIAGGPAAQAELKKLTTGRATAAGVTAQLAEIVDRTQAERLRGLWVSVPRSALPQAAKGEYYWDDLVGLIAHTEQGECLGRISEIRENPAHPLLVIVGEQAGKPIEHLVPLVRGRLRAVDLEQKRVTVDWGIDW